MDIGAHVVALDLPHLSIKALLSKPGFPNEPAVYAEATDAELCAAHWRGRLDADAKIKVLPVSAL